MGGRSSSEPRIQDPTVTQRRLITVRASEYCSRVFMKARCQNVHPSLLTAEQTQIRAVQMFSRPPKQVFVQPAVGQDTRGTRPAAPQQAAGGRFAPPRCKRTLVSNNKYSFICCCRHNSDEENQLLRGKCEERGCRQRGGGGGWGRLITRCLSEALAQRGSVCWRLP